MKVNFKKYQFVFLLLITVNTTSLWAQSAAELYEQQSLSTHEIDKENWHKHTKEIDYDQSAAEKAAQAKAKKRRQKSSGDNPENEQGFFSGPTNFETIFGPIFKVLMIVIGVALLVFLIMKLMNAEQLFSPKNKKIRGTGTKINLEDIEENLHESDLEGFIRQALADNNYALAVRLYYLAILKELSLSNQIKWKRDKTNREYLHEMSGQKLSIKFRETTLIFERVWYGTGELTALVFQELEPKFKTVLKEATA
ncbi:MAG: hypothetical protein ACI9XO_000710 [Paraglaciecola sp.]|jgi:hypothetical protein